MAEPDRRASTGIDRRASMRLSMHQDDDEDHDLEAMGISDGFRPAGVGAGAGHNRISSQSSHNNHLAAGRRTPPPPPRPSSTTKPKMVESFALRHDGGMGDLRRNSTVVASGSNPNPTMRSSSVSSDMPYVRAESPYQGPAGPSHPYQMYPQESRAARTASMATTSTAAPMTERLYAGPSGPTHPYGMYPQNIVPEGESTDNSNQVPPVPVGFIGLNGNYQRRLGPDGEEIADMIGPDGHTEQLPPYSQYPDEAFARKTRPTVAIPAPLPGAGGIGLATRNPEFASQEDLSSPQSRRSVISDTSNHQINTAAATVSEKPPLKKWQQTAKRKVCGIVPIWVIVLVALMFILFGIILAAVFTALKPHPHPHQERPPFQSGEAQSAQTVVTTMTTTFDATPFTAVPTGISALPTGSFVLPVAVPSASQRSCVVNSAQSNAWSCSVQQTATPLELTVNPLPGNASPLTDNEAVLNYGNNTISNVFTYGAQAPVVSQQQVLKLVTDADEPERGPAWWFQLPYNKLVILRETDLSLTPSKRDVVERNGNGNYPQPGDFMRKGVAQPGDKPWFCYWNGTLLEAFIYVNQTSSAGSQQSSSSLSSSATSTATSSSSQSVTYSSSVPTSNVQSQGSTYSGQSATPSFLPAYPRVVKLQERRVPMGQQSISPYCVQHIVNSDGSTSPYMNSTNQPTTVYLNETKPTSISKRDTFEQNLIERDSEDMCGCTWEWS